MDLFSEIIAAVQSDLSVGDESSLYPPATIKLAINRAYRKAGGLFRWPETEDAKKTSTVASQEYYDYPDTWRPDSIWRLEVDDLQYGEDPDGSPLTFADYLTWRRDTANANSTDKKWANQWRRYFIYPVPTTNGSNNICVWGQKTVDALVSNSDTTIFSYSMPECNDAIALEAVEILKNKGEGMRATTMMNAAALDTLTAAWTKIKSEQAKYEKSQPFFYVPDFFDNRSKLKEDIIGNF